MADRPVPQPITVTDEYLAAIHDLLGDIRDRLPERPTTERADGTVELREPKPPATSPGGEKREPAGGGGSPRPAQRRKTPPKKNT